MTLLLQYKNQTLSELGRQKLYTKIIVKLNLKRKSIL